MALNHTISSLKDLLSKITHDLSKAEIGNKAASQRVRTNSVKLEKIAKNYRKESITAEKNHKGTKRTAKKSAKHHAHGKTTKTPATKVKVKPRAKATVARPRGFVLKKPTAKLPIRSHHR